MKVWLAGAAAVCQIVSDGGTRYGNDEITRPRKPSRNRPIVAMKGTVSPPLPQRAPGGERGQRGQQRHRPEIEEIRQREPALPDPRKRKRRPQADRRHEGEHREQQPRGLRARAVGQRPLGLHRQPGRAEQRIAERHAEPAQQRERRRPVERAAGVGAVLDRDALDHAAEDHALGRSPRASSRRRRPCSTAPCWRRSRETRRRRRETPAPAASRSPADRAPA